MSLRGQAGDKLRGLADDGKSKTTTLLDDIANIIDDAARSIDERLGSDMAATPTRLPARFPPSPARYARIGRRLIDETRSVVRKSPESQSRPQPWSEFALMRVIRTGMSDGRQAAKQPNRRSSDSDTTASGGV